ncbi:hypothetical protein EXIGLDRAFT_778386 [Exidia glandulosa HHB12029]|uniref:F-box domain-containing protein n=1 Tax=Exidia glandulosa HHB12029 TaxID=1314781 RepID=A0A165CJH9_EXIGL|nr:hypothetical protein EXIGLDRAFT_778386 [Exidia glandulosa HHB12029]
MFRTRSLSLQIPGIGDIHDHWTGALTTPAPVLERLFLNCTNESSDLPSELFGDQAPSLTNLYLDCIRLPAPTPQAFHGLTILHCDEFDDLTLPAIAPLGQLKTLILSSWDSLSSLIVCAQSIDLFLVGSGPTVVERSVIASYFPNVKSIRYSLYHTMDDEGLDVLSRALDTRDEVTSLFVRWSQPLGIVSWEGSGRNTAALAIEVNSALLAVDVLPQWLLEYLEIPAVLERFTSHLQTATVTEEVWLLFMFVDIPGLKEATILLDEHTDYGKSSLFSYVNGSRSRSCTPALSTLRLSCQQRPPVKRHRNVAIRATHLARHIRVICVGRMLPTLILRDIVPVDPGTKELENLVGVILHEDSVYCADTEELESWTRGIEYPFRDAMTL